MGTASRAQDHGGEGKSTLPGPGSYHLLASEAKSSGPVVAFATAPRFPYVDADVGEGREGAAGPSSYDVHRAQGAVLSAAPAYSFGKARPPVLLPNGAVAVHADEATPGPGYYEVSSDGVVRLLYPTAPAVRFGSGAGGNRADVQVGAESPGPGAYSVRATLLDGPQAVFGSAPTGRAMQAEKETAETASLARAATMSFTPNTRVLAFTIGVPTPTATGPQKRALLDPEATKRSRTGVSAETCRSFRCRVRRAFSGASGGLPQQQPTGAAALRFTAARFPVQDGDEAVGPGSYSPTFAAVDAARRSGGPSFPLAERFTTAEEGEEASGLNGSTAVSFPKAPRMPWRESETDGPGPGAYSPPGTLNYTDHFKGKIGPSFGVGGSERDAYMAGDGTPGPGTYGDAVSAPTGRAASFGIGARTPETDAASATPGPGAYYSPYGGIRTPRE
ncbi:spidroin-2-like, partial [Bactrocera neohumeralis]|uniref:spidroin-2-like n=1 Tax=Bactrocera neohumeralis TaxID=98809 RepID=UPI0021660245